MQFVFERKQIALMADEKSPTRVSHRLLAINRSEMRSNMAKKYNRDLILNGSMLSAILSLAIPVVINSFLQTMYNLTDTYWLGHIGKEELAAINLVTPVQNIVINFGTGVNLQRKKAPRVLPKAPLLDVVKYSTYTFHCQHQILFF